MLNSRKRRQRNLKHLTWRKPLLAIVNGAEEKWIRVMECSRYVNQSKKGETFFELEYAL